MGKIEIWEPRYKDDICLIADYKVEDENEIIFTKAKHLFGKKFYITKQAIHTCRCGTMKTKKGTEIRMWEVPMYMLENR